MSEWQHRTIEDVAEKVAMGPFGSSIKVSTFVPEGIPVISGQHLHEARVQDLEFNFITPEHAEKLRNANVFRGDIIFTHAGNIGQVAYISPSSRYQRYVISQRQFYMRCDTSKVIPSYVTYFFKSAEGQFKLLANSTSSGVPSIARPVTYLRSLEIPVPPLEIQRRIARILGTLDDKIDLNRWINRTLEAIAAEIFKSWFVDFDPVHAKAEGREPVGMDPETAALFPDSFQDSPLGRIPKGWEVSTVDDEFKLTMGQSPPGSTYNEEGNGLPFFQGRRDFGFRFPTKRVFCTSPKRIAEAGDTLVSVRAPVGDVNMAPELLCVGRGLAAVRHQSGSRSYTYYSMLSLQSRFGEYESEGTVFGAINKAQFSGLEWVSPPKELVLEFENRLCAVDQRIELNEQESIELAGVRDSLLPELLSGSVPVEGEHGLSEDTL